MSSESSIRGPGSAVQSKVVPQVFKGMTSTDRRIVALLMTDARIPNNALARAVGIAASTCLSRVRALRESGVIRGYHADVDPKALGRPIQAMIAVKLHASGRRQIRELADSLGRKPPVHDVFFVGGPVDFYIHLSTDSTEKLRDFVVSLSADRAVASTETNLIFEHIKVHSIS